MNWISSVAVGAGVVEKLFCLFDEGALVWGAGDGNAAAAPEVEEAFVTQLPQCAQDGVG